MIRYQPRLPVPWDGWHVLADVPAVRRLGSVAARLSSTCPRAVDAAARGGNAQHAPPACEDGAAGHGNLWVLSWRRWRPWWRRPSPRSSSFACSCKAGWRRPSGVIAAAAAGVAALAAAPGPSCWPRCSLPPSTSRPAASRRRRRWPRMVIADAIAKLVAMAGIVMLLRIQPRRHGRRFRLGAEEARRRRGLGVAAFVAVAPAVFSMQWLLQELLEPPLPAGEGGGRSAAAVLLRLGAGDALLPDAPHRAVDRHARRPERHDAGALVI